VLNLGCGTKKKDGEIGLDKHDLLGIDVVWDLENIPLPFKDNEFDVIIASHIMEHIVNFYPLMEELYRILKPNGILKITSPYFVSFKHPDHKRAFSQHSFKHFRQEYSKNYITKARFRERVVELHFTYHGSMWDFLNAIFNPILNLWKGFTEKFFPHLIDEIYFELEAVK